MVRFLPDNDLSFRITGALDALDTEHEARALRKVYGAEAADLDWIPKAAKEGWILVSNDLMPTRRSPEKAALQGVRLTAVYIRPFFGKMRFWDQAVFLVRVWPKVAGWALAFRPGTVGEVQQGGTSNEKRL